MVTKIETIYDVAFNAILEAIIIVDAIGQIVFANLRANELFQFEENALLGQPLDVLMPQQYHQSHQRWLTDYTNNPRARIMKGMQLEAQRRDQTIFPVEISLSPIAIEDEMYTIAMIIDITERIQMEEKLRKAELLQAKLAQEQTFVELKNRFVAMLSHEFRNPLAVINTSANLLHTYFDRLAPDKREQHTLQIQTQIQKILDLLDDVLHVSKSGSSQVTFNPIPTDLETFCRSICHRLGLSDDKRFTFHAGELGEVLIDQNVLTHILENLLTNAQKYTPEEGKIHFTITQEEEEIVFKVSDTGIGITSKDQVYLFDPFHRGSNVSNVSGTGLGLTIVKNNVILHDGTIDFTSKPEEGTTFVVRLPANIKHYLSQSVYTHS